MSIGDYLSLYSMFSPEHNTQLAEGVNKLRQTQQGEQFAQQQGAPNLSALKLGEETEQHKSLLGLREAMAGNRQANADTGNEERLANLAMSGGMMPEAHQLLGLAMQKYGITPQSSAGGLTDDQRKAKLQALFGGQPAQPQQ